MGRSPCCAKEGLNRGAWTALEDKMLTDYIQIHGEGRWRNLPKRAGLKRCGKSCRLRWLNYLRPGIKRGNITHDEEDLIIRLHNLLGNRWSLIAGRLPGRTDNEIKNYWNTNLSKKLQDPKIPKIKTSLSTSNADTKKVFWTKPSRCTRVVIPSTVTHDEPPKAIDNGIIKPMVELPSIGKDSADDESQFATTTISDKNNNISSPNLSLDFEMDEHFLSDFLDADFNASKFFMVSDDAMQDSELLSMDSLLIESWAQDQV